MAYDYGSINLGIKNPFVIAGSLRAGAGFVTAVLGLIALFQVPGTVATNSVLGWTTAIAGFILLGWGLALVARGVFQTMRFFVGRSVPASLAPNQAEINASSTGTNKADINYTPDQLEQMLMARKNLTFAEPVGWLARGIHSLIPRLTFIPAPYRNLMQRMAAIVVVLLVSLVCLSIVTFLTTSGLLAHGELIIPLFMLALIVVLGYTLQRHSRGIARRLKHLEDIGSRQLSLLIAASVVVPVAFSVALSRMISRGADHAVANSEFMRAWGGFPTVGLLLFLIVGASVVCALCVLVITYRIRLANPETRVSEYRDNWQENIHPRDLFVATETLIMAERRHKEVPNRQYIHEPLNLQEQTESKGSFDGRLMQETQPEYRPLQWSQMACNLRLGITVFAQLLLLAMPVFVFFLPGMINDIVSTSSGMGASNGDVISEAIMSGQFAAQVQTLVVSGFVAFVMLCFGRILNNACQLMWAEMTFESLMLYVKADGTFTESRLSTGQSIYDSTRSENTVVRSSITPWILVSRVVSSTIAAAGVRNLEFPRMVLTMNADDAELNAILNDYRQFLDQRESLASVTSAADAESLSNFHSVNVQSRADYRSQGQSTSVLNHTEDDEASKAAGAIRDETEKNQERDN